MSSIGVSLDVVHRLSKRRAETDKHDGGQYRMKRLRMKLLAALLFCAAASGAQAAMGDATAVSGGVGDEDRDALMQAYDQYNLHLAFAEKTGDYVADVGVKVRDSRGREMWSGNADGPLLFMKLPPGRYEVIADFDGKEQRRSVQVGPRGGRLVTLLW
jgi:hypothetical protein